MADMTARGTAQAAFLRAAGWDDGTSTVVAGDASNRRYERLMLCNGTTAILMDAPPAKGEDVTPFVTIAKHLKSHGFSAPEIFHADPEAGFLLIEDLGDDLFARLMARDPTRQMPLYAAATDVLIALHQAPILPVPPCDANWLITMTEPAFEWYARSDAGTLVPAFAQIFMPLARSLDHVPRVLILRDYHAENLLWLPRRTGRAQVGLLDFQDALLGHPAYDLVSVLQDARRDVPPDIEAAMIARYIAATGTDPAAFRAAYAILGVQRNLRILGIFARLCLRDGKAQYVDLIPRVWGYMQRNLEDAALAPLAALIDTSLPQPTPDFLEHLKSICAITPTP